MRGLYILLALAVFSSGIAYVSYKRGEADCNTKHAHEALKAAEKQSAYEMQVSELEKKLNAESKNDTGSDIDVIRAGIIRLHNANAR